MELLRDLIERCSHDFEQSMESLNSSVPRNIEVYSETDSLAIGHLPDVFILDRKILGLMERRQTKDKEKRSTH